MRKVCRDCKDINSNGITSSLNFSYENEFDCPVNLKLQGMRLRRL